MKDERYQEIEVKYDEQDYKREKLKAECGAISNIIGSGENARINYIGIVLFLLVVFLAIYTLFYGYENSNGLFQTILPVITTIIGYIAGRKT